MCAALQSLKASKLPRRVLPSTAIAVRPSEGGGVEIDNACWRNEQYVDMFMPLASIFSCVLLTLTNFEYLRIQVARIANYDRCLKRLLQLIFVENDVFHSLKHFVFQCNENSDILSLPVTTKQTKLEFLTLPALYRDEFVQLLTCIPHIKSLKTGWLYTIFNSTTISPLNSALLNCLDLNLQLDQQWTFEDIQFLLQQIPNVNQLKLTCNYLLIKMEINGNVISKKL